MSEAEHHLTDTMRPVVTMATPVRPNVPKRYQGCLSRLLSVQYFTARNDRAVGVMHISLCKQTHTHAAYKLLRMFSTPIATVRKGFVAVCCERAWICSESSLPLQTLSVAGTTKQYASLYLVCKLIGILCTNWPAALGRVQQMKQLQN